MKSNINVEENIKIKCFHALIIVLFLHLKISSNFNNHSKERSITKASLLISKIFFQWKYFKFEILFCIIFMQILQEKLLLKTKIL